MLSRIFLFLFLYMWYIVYRGAFSFYTFSSIFNFSSGSEPTVLFPLFWWICCPASGLSSVSTSTSLLIFLSFSYSSKYHRTFALGRNRLGQSRPFSNIGATTVSSLAPGYILTLLSNSIGNKWTILWSLLMLQKILLIMVWRCDHCWGINHVMYNV